MASGAARDASGADPINLLKRDFAFRAVREALLGDADRATADGLVRPLARQEETQGDAHGHFIPREGERDERLAIRRLPRRVRVLARHANGVRALLQKRGVIDDEHRIRPAGQALRLLCEHALQRLDALALARRQEAARVHGRPLPAVLVAKRRPERPRPAVELSLPCAVA